MKRSLLWLLPALLCGCDPVLGNECGGGQYATAWAFLPDTGINAGDSIHVEFVQHDTNELSELAVWHVWPFTSAAIDPEPDPRIRIVGRDERVLLDSIGSRYSQPTNRYDRPTWHVFSWIRDARLRTALFEGFRDRALWLELRRVGEPGLGTRVPLVVERVGVTERVWCA